MPAKTHKFKPDNLSWCELDVIGTFLVANRKDFIDHITTFGYTQPEANIMVGHIANKIFNSMCNIDPDTNLSRHTPHTPLPLPLP